jgi:type IV pilus assembly protein PilM
MIGIDIGTKYIKLCEVQKKDKEYRIFSALMASNPLQGQQDPKQNGELIRRIKMMAGEACLTTRRTATSIGGSQILARNFSLQGLTPDELKGAVRFEAEQSVSSDLNAMYTDFQVLAKTDDDKSDVLFVGVPREIVDHQMQLLQSTGLETELMDIDNLALANCYLTFDPNAHEESVVLLNIGDRFTNLSVIDDGKLRFVRNIDFGGRDITLEIAHAFDLTEEIAEKLKKQPDLWPEIGLNILRKSMPNTMEAVYRSIEYCMSRKKLLNVDKILLTGGSASLHGLKGFISEVLGIYAETWNPFEHLTIKGEVEKDKGLFFSIALGLALRKGKNV